MYNAANAPFLEPGEEHALAVRWREHRDERARNKLVSSHLQLAQKIARMYVGKGQLQDDLVHQGAVGLMKATDRFDPSNGSFRAYAWRFIEGEIQRYLIEEREGGFSGRPKRERRLFFRLQAKKRKLGIDDFRDLAPEAVAKLADSLGHSVDEVLAVNARAVTVEHLPDGDSDYSLVWHSLERTESASEEELENACYENELLFSAKGILTQREREIVRGERPPDELAEEYSISLSRFFQIRAAAFRKMRAHVKRSLDEATNDGAILFGPPRSKAERERRAEAITKLEFACAAQKGRHRAVRIPRHADPNVKPKTKQTPKK